MMRRTVTLDEDVAAGIKREMERSGQSFKQIVNRLVRLGFGVPEPTESEKPTAISASSRKNKTPRR